jgi:hypothetical protein
MLYCRSCDQSRRERIFFLTPKGLTSYVLECNPHSLGKDSIKLCLPKSVNGFSDESPLVDLVHLTTPYVVFGAMFVLSQRCLYRVNTSDHKHTGIDIYQCPEGVFTTI